MKNDDERFLALVSRITSSLIQDIRPKDIFITRIDHWFDHKWLAFSGQLLGAVVARKRRLTIPPFMPRRVAWHQAYTRDAGEAAYRVASVPPLHRRQPSRENLTRFIDRISKSAVFIWFSGGTGEAEHGSLMVYSVQAELLSAWYASFRGTHDWRVHKVCGLSKPELMNFIERGAESNAA